MSFFENKYKEAFKQLNLQLSEKDGVEEYYIGIQEQLMDIQFPRALRQYYLIAGRHGFNTGQNQLLSVNELYTWKNYLVFMKESNGMENWGIQLEQIKDIDPPIYAGLDSISIDPYIQDVCCSDFLIFTLFSHAITGGFEHHEEVYIKPSVLQKIKEDWKNIGGGFYSSIGKIVFISNENFKNEEDVLIAIAGTKEKDFIEMMWDFSAKLHYET